MTDSEMTPGEIQRWLERIDASITMLTIEVRERHSKMSEDVKPISTLSMRMATAEMQIGRLDADVTAVRTQSATIAGGIGALAFLSSLIPWPWRH